MSKKKDFKGIDKKTWILMALATVAFVIVVVVIVIVSRPEKIDSGYFHDDENKIVLTMSGDMSALDDSPYESGVVHVVYYYNGDKIASARVFYEYPDEEMAKIAFSKLEPGEYANNKKLNGKYVIFDLNKTQYEDLTVEELRQNIELLKLINALILDYDENTVNEYPISFDGAEDVKVVEDGEGGDTQESQDAGDSGNSSDSGDAQE